MKSWNAAGSWLKGKYGHLKFRQKRKKGSYFRKQLEDHLKTLELKADLVYDIGGKEKSIRGRTRSWDVKELVCLDVPEYDLNRPQNLDRQADMVFCLEVFEYIFNPAQAFLNLFAALKPGGSAVVSFPFVYPIHKQVELDSLRYTIAGIRRLAEYAGLEVRSVTPRKAKTATLTKYYSEDGMKGARGEDHSVTGYIVELRRPITDRDAPGKEPQPDVSDQASHMK